jgi:outer membrane cobalamin receptor
MIATSTLPPRTTYLYTAAPGRSSAAGVARNVRQWILVSAALLALAPRDGLAQADSIPAPSFHLDEIVVVAHRFGAPLRESVAATSVLTREDLNSLAARTLPEVLRAIPGLLFVERDGGGRLPMAVARGFFGGGETSYVLLTVDGVPVNDGRTGVVEWTQIPLSEIERVEVLRGSASEAYGDAALGAVVNVVTRGIGATEVTEGGLSLGSRDAAQGWGSLSRFLGAGRLRGTVDFDRDDGQRAHSASSRLGTSLAYRTTGDGSGTSFARVSFSRLTNEEPGPLTAEDLSADRTASHPSFSADERTRSVADLTLGTNRDWEGDRRLDGAVRLRWLDQERTRTLLLAPQFGDTQLLDDRDLSAWGRVQYAMPVERSTLRVGGEMEVASFDSRYLSPSEGTLLSEGQASQTKLALHAGLRRPVGARVMLHGGIRYDAVLPRADGSESPAATFHQWSPRLALNVAYSARASAEGNLFVSWTRAFKAPSLDQLFDAREIPTGEPGQTLNISNAALKPQRSSAVEVGAYQRLPLGGRYRFAEMSVSLYLQELEDEIDFDVRTYRYGNILRSRHSGVEGSLRVALARRLRVDHSATVSRATFRSSDNDGNQLKNIPETAYVTTLGLGVAGSVGLTLTHRHTGGVWLDDENTQRLDGSSLFDGALRWSVGRVEASLSARNLFDTDNDSFGYLLFDPIQGASQRMVHPGPGRSLDLRLTVRGS